MGAASPRPLHDSLPEGCSSSWRITRHRESIALSWAMGWIPHLTIMMISPDGALENTYVVFSQMKLWRTPMWCSPGVLWGFFICRCWDSPAPPLPPRPGEASPAAAPPPPHPGPSSLPELRNSTQPGPSPQRNQRFASKNVLVHETLPAIALMTVASLEITHIRDSPLAIVQTTDGDSLQEIPLLLCV